MHGPEHHFLVPASLITAYCNHRGEPGRKGELLARARERASRSRGFLWNPRHLRCSDRDGHICQPDHRVNPVEEAGVVALKPDDSPQPDGDRPARRAQMLQTQLMACDPHRGHIP
jgi:hypothetical protein